MKAKLVPLLLLALGAAAASGEIFETPPVLEAGELLTAEQLRGPHHQVAEEVVNDGYVNIYRIISEFGEFEAHGRTMLSVRLAEVAALQELSVLSRTEVFAQAVARAGVGQIEVIGEFAQRPVETIKGIPGGAKRWLKRTKRNVEEVVGSAEETGSKGSDSGAAGQAAEAGKKYADKYFGTSRSQLAWAQKLRVDPYTSNPVLQKALRQVAKVDAAGAFTARLTLPGIPGVDLMAGVTDLVWSTDPRELRDLNVKALVDGGADPAKVESFFANPWFSPTLQTLLVARIAELGDVAGRGLLIEAAASAESETEAVFFVEGARMLTAFHRSSGPIERLVGDLYLPGAVTGDGRLVYLLPVDHISFTAEVAGAGDRLAAVAEEAGPSRRELWLQGTASARYRQEAAARGWTVREQVGFSGERAGKAGVGTPSPDET